MPFSRRDADFDTEIEAHIAIEVDQLVAEGMPLEDARAQARRRFGNVTAARERFYEARRVLWWDMVRQDVRIALRSSLRDRGVVLVALLTLAIGIGATTAIVSTVNAVLLRPLPYADPDRLVMVWEDMTALGFPQNTPAPANYFDWLERNRVFDGMAATVATASTATSAAISVAPCRSRKPIIPESSASATAAPPRTSRKAITPYAHAVTQKAAPASTSST